MKKELLSMVSIFVFGLALVAFAPLALAQSSNIPHCQGIMIIDDLSLGSTSNTVKCLQALLNQSPDTTVAVSGPGSPGNETAYFGKLTKTAVMLFQQKNASSILTPLGLTPGTGIVGPRTRDILNNMISGVVQSSSTQPTTSNNIPTQSSVPTLNLASSTQFSNHLTAANGMTLYTYNKDTLGVSNCTGVCITSWPPYTVSSTTNISTPTNIPGLVGTITLQDGTLQVTYNGLPLYFWNQDKKPGDTTGNGVGGFSIVTINKTPTQPQSIPTSTNSTSSSSTSSSY